MTKNAAIQSFPCHFQQLFIKSDGSIIPCCRIYGRQDLVIGYIDDIDLDRKLTDFAPGSCSCPAKRLRQAGPGDRQEYELFNIEVSVTCQAKCAMCCVQAPERTEQGEQYNQYEDLTRLIARYKPKRILVQGGEVLIQEKTLNWLAELRTNHPDMVIGLVTNANVPLSQLERVEAIFDDISVSFVGFQPETYRRIMGLELDKTKAFVEHLLARAKVKVGLKFLVTPLTLHEAPLFFQWAVRCNPQRIFFHDAATTIYIKLDTWDSFWHKIIKRTAKEMQRMLREYAPDLRQNSIQVFLDSSASQFFEINRQNVQQAGLEAQVFFEQDEDSGQPGKSWRDILEYVVSFRGKRVALFGTGKTAERVWELLRLVAVPVAFCLDNAENKQGQLFHGLPIYPPAEIAARGGADTVILVASMYYNDIAKQLRSMKLQQDRHFFDAQPMLKFFEDQGEGDGRC